MSERISPPEVPQPEAEAFAQLFNCVTTINNEQGLMPVFKDIMAKEAITRELIEGGLDEQTASAYAASFEGSTPGTTEAIQNLAFTELQYGPQLLQCGLSFDKDDSARLLVTDGPQFISAIQSLPESEITPEIQIGFTALIEGFTFAAHRALLDADPTRTKESKGGWLPIMDREYEHLLEPKLIDPDLAHSMTVMAEHAQAILPELERIGIDEDQCNKLQAFTLAWQENAALEWAVAEEMKVFNRPDEYPGTPWQQWINEDEWREMFDYLTHLRQKLGPNSPFVAYIGNTLVKSIEASERGDLRPSQMPLSKITPEDDDSDLDFYESPELKALREAAASASEAQYKALLHTAKLKVSQILQL